MTTQPPNPAGPGGPAAHVHDADGGPFEDDRLDAANQSLAEALRKSFRVLKLLMFVLVVLYAVSGWFSVKPNEVGLVLRFGRIVGTGEHERTQSAVLPPGWHWSLPYPFERWVTVETNEREVPIEFLFQMTEEERTSGKIGYKLSNLSPARDDYLITGDVNILHASIVVKYRITDPVAYLTHVSEMPDPEATVRSRAFRLFPEYTLLTSLARNAMIETAAKKDALEIRGPGQNAFLEAVALSLNAKLKALEKAGWSLGIEIDPTSGILAPKSTTLEAIMPPRQVQEVFDKVFAAQTDKARNITRAFSEAQAQLLETAGLEYEAIAASTQREYELMLALSESQTAARSGGSTETVDLARQALADQRKRTEGLLMQASGDVQTIINDARIRQSEIIKEASGDHDKFQKVLPEYAQNPEIFVSRMLEDFYAKALENPRVAKVFVPRDAREYRLHIPRSPESGSRELQAMKESRSKSQRGAKPRLGRP